METPRRVEGGMMRPQTELAQAPMGAGKGQGGPSSSPRRLRDTTALLTP